MDINTQSEVPISRSLLEDTMRWRHFSKLSLVSVAAIALGFSNGVLAYSDDDDDDSLDNRCAFYPLKHPFFGDTHVHTALSFDAASFGNLNGQDAAYAFAQGAWIGHWPNTGWAVVENGSVVSRYPSPTMNPTPGSNRWAMVASWISSCSQSIRRRWGRRVCVNARSTMTPHRAPPTPMISAPSITRTPIRMASLRSTTSLRSFRVHSCHLTRRIPATSSSPNASGSMRSA